MAGRDANEAFANYIEPMREALQCITLQRLTAKRTKRWELGRTYSAALDDMNAVHLRGQTPLRLVVGQQFQIHRLDDAEDPRGPYKVHTVQYLYEISTSADDEILSFHWTPEQQGAGVRTFPHLHVGPALTRAQQNLRPADFHRVHIPTGRVSLESIVRLAIEEFRIKPLRQDWSAVLERTEQAFMNWRTR